MMATIPRAAVLLLFVPALAFAHAVVDLFPSIGIPPYVAANETVTYVVDAFNLEYDSAFGALLEHTPPAGARVTAATGRGWRCETGATVRCSAEELTPGSNPIEIRATFTRLGENRATAFVETIGSADPNPANDRTEKTFFVYERSACPRPELRVEPAEGTGGPSTFRWNEIAAVESYELLVAVEGEAPRVLGVVREPQLTMRVERGDVEWFVRATFNGCPPLESNRSSFRSEGPQPVLTLRDFAGARGVPGAADGATASARFRDPAGLAWHAETGTLYVADRGNSTVRALDGNLVRTWAGSPGQRGVTEGTPGRFDTPSSLAIVPNGYLFVTDPAAHVVRLVYPWQYVLTIGGTPQTPGTADGDGARSQFAEPSAVATTRDGSMYVADTANSLVRKLTPLPQFIGFYRSSTLRGEFRAPAGIAVSADDHVFVSDTGNNAVKVIAPDGSIRTLAAGLDRPGPLALDPYGNLYVAEPRAIKKIAPSGLVTTVAAGFAATGMVFTEEGTLFVSVGEQHMVMTGSVGIPADRRRAAGR